MLTLTSVAGRPLLTPGQLAHDVRTGQVRYALLGGLPCRRGVGTCAPVVRWALAHGSDVSRAAGLPHRGMLYRLGGA